MIYWWYDAHTLAQMLIINYVKINICGGCCIQNVVILIIYVPCHVIKIFVIVIFWIGYVEMSAAYPPTKAGIIGPVYQYHRTVWPSVTQEIYLRCEHMAFYYLDTTLCSSNPGFIKLLFTVFFAVLIKLIKPAAKFHTGIKVCAYVHEI